MTRRRGSPSGWMVSLIETLMSEYHFTIRRAIWGIPVAAVFALLPAKRAREGDDSLPTFAEMASVNARAACREYLEKHYQII